MPRNKDLKRLVRARMRKTGEAYTAARAHVLKKRPSPRVAEVLSAPPVKDYATIAGMSDKALKEKTGCTWERWVKALDHYGAAEMKHRDIAALVAKTYHIDGWWAQNVAVGYERIKGLRARGQQRDGTYHATKSKTFNVPVDRLFDAWAKADIRRQWLTGASVTVRKATPHKSMRLGLGDGSIVAVGFLPKGKTKSSVAVEHTKLASREAATGVKGFWTERFATLAEVIADG
jgi:hypothetical protein